MRRLTLFAVLVCLLAPVADVRGAAFDTTYAPSDLRQAYKEARRGDKFKILVVPGHDDQFSGTSYGGLREADLNLALAQRIKELLEQDDRLDVRLARTAHGYDPELAEYFIERREQVWDFVEKHKERMARHIADGKVEPAEDGVPHAVAPTEAAYRLYAINKWSAEEDYLIVLHVHFNDTARYNLAYPGPYSGLGLYVPERQFGNARASRAVGLALLNRLLEVHYPSTLPGEGEGVVEDQELIALGANNTAKAASILVEYAYIYERRVQDARLRAETLESMANATYLGLRDFLKG